ncbi:MAG: hypothetical protein IJW40_09695 [Clostridia bacterium]|nr:hypothetical protein [Clostridia bacterium]
MKKTMISLTRMLCAAVAVLLLAASLGGCAEKLPEMKTSLSYESRVRGGYPGGTCWNDFIVLKTGTIFNRQTGELLREFCEDPECDGSCIWESGGIEVQAVRDGRIYFSLFGAGNRKDIYYCYRSILTGENVILYTMQMDNRSGSGRVFEVDDGWIYFTEKRLDEQSNPNLPESYTEVVYRVPVDGGEREEVYELREGEGCAMVLDGRMFTKLEDVFYITELATMEQSVYHSGACPPLPVFPMGAYIDGKFISAAILEQTEMHLIVVDEQTRECKVVGDVPVRNYCITNDAIYFWPVDPHQINDPSIYPPESDGYVAIGDSPTLFACDLDGENIRKVWTEQTGLLEYAGDCTIVDGVLYGWMREFDLKTNAFGERFFAEIHFDTGEIIRAIEVE